LVTLDGTGLTSENRLAVVDGECGTIATASAFPNPISPDDPISPDVDFRSYNFGTPAFDSGKLGDTYRLCWTFQQVDGLQDYLFEVDGSAELHGPSAGAVACTLGLKCLATVSGFGLSNASGATVLSSGTCGDAWKIADRALWGLASPEINNGTSAMYSFGIVDTFSSPGVLSYKLCWGSEPGADLAECGVDLAATVVLSGPDSTAPAATALASSPSGSAHFICRLGKVCTIVVTGYGLSATNRIAPVTTPACDSCNCSGSSISIWSSAIFSPISVAPDALSATFRLGAVMVGTPGTDFKLCWSHGAEAIPANMRLAIDLDGELHGPELECACLLD
jgi:hypothetical protein